MTRTETPGEGKALARTSNIAFVAAAACLAVALSLGALGTLGVFTEVSAGALALMFAAAGGAVFFAAEGLVLRRRARLAGWKPAWERNTLGAGNFDGTAAHTASVATAPAITGEAAFATSAATSGTTPAPAASALETAVAHSGETSSEAAATTSDTATGAVASNSTIPGAASSSEAHAGTTPAAGAPGARADAASNASPEKATPAFANPTKRAQSGTPQHKSAAAMMAKERSETLERMVVRSEDIFALARDLTKTGKSVAAFADLATMLARSDALKLEGPPRISPIKLTRNGRYWLGADVAEASDEAYDAVVSLEAALNIAHDAHDALSRNPVEVERLSTEEKALMILTAAAKAKPSYASRMEVLTLVQSHGSDQGIRGDWAFRERIANAAENASLPFRIVFDMRTHAQGNLAYVQLQVPRPGCFSIVTTDAAEQQELARDYAFRSALFMAHVVLGAADPTGSHNGMAVITCHERGGEDVLLSLEATHANIASLDRIAAQPAPIQTLDHPDLRLSFQNSWLDPIAPHLDEDDPIFDLECYTTCVELSDRKCSPRIAAATGASYESDLGTDESAAIRQAWAALECRLAASDPTTGAAVATVRDLQSSSENTAITEACSRVMRALVDGTAEPSQIEQLETIFTSGGALGDALAAGALTLASRDGAEVERAADGLRKALSPALQIGLMDDTESVFRYFHNTAERVEYNLHLSDGRRVQLVSQGYYAANEMLVHLLCLVNRPDEAVPYANELMRLAPLSASAAITKARVLEDQSKLFEALDLMNDCIAHAPTVRDAALAYYRMAYLQWRTGSHEGAAACYRTSISLRTDISAQAQVELSELLSSDSEQKDYVPDEAKRMLQEKGVSIWPREERQHELARAAVACTDERLYPVALQLSYALLEFSHDDALVDICRSLTAN